MRILVVVALLVGTTAHSEPAAPLRVRIECESEGRTKACPAFLLGFVEASKLFLSSPRASAEVVLYVTTTEVVQLDRVHLRFVGKVTGAPPIVEIDVELDTRANDDTQRAQLEPAFARGIALFVAARHPKAVTIAFAVPDAGDVAKPVTSPYGIALSLGGFGNYTKQFRNYNGFGTLEGSRITKTSRGKAQLFGNGGINRQPPLELGDGSRVSLDTEQWTIGASGDAVYLLCSCWSVGAATRVWRDDPKGQFRYGWNGRAGVEWDKYKADDPRGNRLAVLAFVGWQAEGYNLRNVIGERQAQYPIGGAITSGSVRKDKISIGLSLSILSQLDHVGRRSNLSAAPFIQWKLGGHVDINVSFSVTKRQLPAPDRSLIDPLDYEQLSRLSFAEPLAAFGSLNLSIHFDRTNGARNDRFDDF